uniref:hypothetical protein n=1 Tax=Lentinus flexipes TaxID=3163629 RepID=UPI0022649B6A|nr:hypothetical protein OSR58_mgp10 [Ganoderma flexipes]UYX56951.1 hypothetical protein [Ganoderma flexipes]
MEQLDPQVIVVIVACSTLGVVGFGGAIIGIYVLYCYRPVEDLEIEMVRMSIDLFNPELILIILILSLISYLLTNKKTPLIIKKKTYYYLICYNWNFTNEKQK